MFCSDPMSGSHFITQTCKFLLIDATAVTLGQGHGKVIQYISRDGGAKVVAAAATPAADAAEKNWKHKVTPDWGYLIIDGKQVQVKLLSKTMNTPIMNTICVIQLSLRQTPADNNI